MKKINFIQNLSEMNGITDCIRHAIRSDCKMTAELTADISKSNIEMQETKIIHILLTGKYSYDEVLRDDQELQETLKLNVIRGMSESIYGEVRNEIYSIMDILNDLSYQDIRVLDAIQKLVILNESLVI